MSNPYFSLIIPLYNGMAFVDRLFQSLARQRIAKDELEIIVCDDHSTDQSITKIMEYSDQFNITIIQTKDREMHCPSNTRHDALPYATGEWITFCDQDDYFEDYAFANVKHFIEATGELYLVCTQIKSWDDEKGVEQLDLYSYSAWLHGKFYSRKNLIEPFQIQFKEDLYSHEDIYFNSQCYAALYELGIDDYTIFDIPTYRWCNNPNSITRSFDNDGLGYTETYLNDYIYASSEPYLKEFKKNTKQKELYRNMILMSLLHAFFYYNAQAYSFGKKRSEENFVNILNARDYFKKELDMTGAEICDYIHSDPIKYDMVRHDCIATQGRFVEVISFLDFMKTKN